MASKVLMTNGREKAENLREDEPKRKVESDPVPRGLAGMGKSTISSAGTNGSDGEAAKRKKTAKAEPKKEVVAVKKLPVLAQAHREDFRFVFSTLAIRETAGIATILSNVVELQRRQTRLNEAELHPLTSLRFFSRELRVSLVQMRTVFTTWLSIYTVTTALGQNAWTLFITETSAELASHHGRKEVVPFIKQFATETGLNEKKLLGFVKTGKWEEFIHHCLGIE